MTVLLGRRVAKGALFRMFSGENIESPHGWYILYSSSRGGRITL